MRFLVCCFLCCLALFLGSNTVLAQNPPRGILTEERSHAKPQPVDEVVAARGVLQRTLGMRAGEFRLKLIPKQGTKDRYRFSAQKGVVQIEATSGVTLCRAAYDYLKQHCRVQVTWDSPKIDGLPARLPDAPSTDNTCESVYRHYFNVCTFGYTTAFWDWRRWEQEIDWMALHGINMPLAMNGQEAVWQRVWRGYGISDKSILEYFGGPAFLPWHRMGNVNGHGGPMPQSFLDGQVVLQKQILTRQRSLGMTPVTPGFSGFVPPALATFRPYAKIRRSSGWCGFEPTYQLDARDPLFIEIGARFIKEYRRVFGSDSLYLADLFNEMSPQVTPENRLGDLADYAKATYESILAGDAKGKWVMQGWLFYNESSFWRSAEVSAFLNAVPDDRMILLDLHSEVKEVWRDHDAMRKKPWIWNVLHNFGQSMHLSGNLAEYIKRYQAAKSDPNRGGMIGAGLTMEGIEQNPIVYELVTDLMWARADVDLESWLDDYVEQRYRVNSPKLKEAWRNIVNLFYSGRSGGTWGSEGAYYLSRPRFDRIPEPDFADQKLTPILDAFESEASRVGNRKPFARDYIDLMKEWLANKGQRAVWVALAHSELNEKDDEIGEDPPEKEAQRESQFFRHINLNVGILQDLDRLLATLPEYRLTEWIAGARRHGKNEAEKRLLEKNARMQVTVWGGPILYDYASKEWAGLVESFYAMRWQFAFLSLEESRGRPNIKGLEDVLIKFENAFCEESGRLRIRPAESPLRVASELLKKYRDFLIFPVPRGIAVGKPVTVSGGTERGGDPEFAVDGKLGGGFWSASPSPQWLQVDLEKPEWIDRIHLYTYHGDGRYYQYRILGSMDGKDWIVLENESQNTDVAESRGYRHDFAKRQVRYVRVEMLKNSANIGLHIRELRIFRAAS